MMRTTFNTDSFSAIRLSVLSVVVVVGVVVGVGDALAP